MNKSFEIDIKWDLKRLVGLVAEQMEMSLDMWQTDIDWIVEFITINFIMSVTGKAIQSWREIYDGRKILRASDNWWTAVVEGKDIK